MITRRETTLEQFAGGRLLTPGRPEGLQLQPLIIAVGIGKPVRRRQHLLWRSTAELPLGSLPGVHLGKLQVLEQRGDRFTFDPRRLDERAIGTGDPVDAAVGRVSQRIPRAVLHVADERVMPVEKIETAIGPDLQITGTEVSVGRLDQILAKPALDFAAILDDLKILDAQEADRIGVEIVTLDHVGEVP